MSSVVSSVLSPAEIPARRKAVPQIGPLTPPTLPEIVRPIFLRTAPDVRLVPAVVVARDDLEAVAEREAEVAVADDRVELSEVLRVVDDRRGHRLDDEVEIVERRFCHTNLLRSGREAALQIGQGDVVGWPSGPAVRDDPRALAVRVAER